MRKYNVLLPYGLMIFFCSPILQAGAETMRSPQTKLSMAEAVYVMMSNGFRKLADISPATPEEIKTMNIVQLDGSTIRKYPINDAFESLKVSSEFNKTRQTKIIIHGYKDSFHAKIPWNLAQAYHEKKTYNVLLVDIEKLMNTNWYPSAVRNSQMISNELGKLIIKLEDYGVKAEEFHFLGISLGAHIAGWTGKNVYKQRRKKIGRITGLDPAGPCFTFAPANKRLDSGDAGFVDVIHSNRLQQGVLEPVGHVDFYLNGGGPRQPGCGSSTCSHLRATEVFTESILSPDAFVGVECKSWNNFQRNTCNENFSVLGDQTSTETRGVYYLRTNSKSPFGLGMNGTRNENPKNTKSSNEFIRRLFKLLYKE